MSNDSVFDPVPGTDATMFIQWKGTDLCIDFYCPCGEQGHFDGFFAYYLKCPACGQVFEMGTQVRARLVDEQTITNRGREWLIQTLDVDEPVSVPSTPDPACGHM